MRTEHRAAHGEVTERDLVLVRLETDAGVGWGEAAPVAGYSPDTVDEVWLALTAADSTAPLPPSARAALVAASTDVAAQNAGAPLWRHLAGTAAPVAAGAVIGRGDTAEVVAVVAAAVAGGYRHVKLKVTPETIAVAEAVRTAHPSLSLAADGNGSFSPAVLDADRVDRLELAYLEQPFPVGAEAETAALATELATPVCLDESVPVIDDWDELGIDAAAIAAPTLGGLDRARAALAAASAASLALKAGGTLESAVGRAAAMALATRPEFTLPSELSPSTRYLGEDVARSRWELRDGDLIPPEEPGAGVVVDEDEVRHRAISTMLLPAGIWRLVGDR